MINAHAKAMDDIDRAAAILKTVWLATTSDSFEDADVDALSEVIYEAMSKIESARKSLSPDRRPLAA